MSRHIVTNDVEREMGLAGEFQQFRRSELPFSQPYQSGRHNAGARG